MARTELGTPNSDETKTKWLLKYLSPFFLTFSKVCDFFYKSRNESICIEFMQTSTLSL